ncbi:hypothetical protein D0T87_18815 [Bacteroides sp. 51]|nr:hypothetical protein [Bacteroides sp. 51]
MERKITHIHSIKQLKNKIPHQYFYPIFSIKTIEIENTAFKVDSSSCFFHFFMFKKSNQNLFIFLVKHTGYLR